MKRIFIVFLAVFCCLEWVLCRIYNCNKVEKIPVSSVSEQIVALELKDVHIIEGESYQIDDFVLKCLINGKEVCELAYEDEKMGTINKSGEYVLGINIKYLENSIYRKVKLIVDKKKVIHIKKKKTPVSKKQVTVLEKKKTDEVIDVEKSVLLDEISVLKRTENEKVNSVFNLLNQYRSECGDIQKLILDDDLTSLAFIRALEMASAKVLSHKRPNGKDFYSVFEEYNIKPGRFTGENIASGYLYAHSVSLGWKNSLPHYQNMIHKDFKKVGIGVACKHETCYWVQLFSS